MKRVAVLADLHCYHRAGLTHPEWWLPKDSIHYGKWGTVQRELYGHYLKIIEKVSPVDALIINGDCFDGRGDRSGGTELLPDPSWGNQIALAEACIREWGVDGSNIVMSRGTPYHTGQASDYEDVLAMHLGATIKDHPFVEIEGVTFDIKHKVGSSSIPHGRNTPIARERLWNVLWADGQPRADVLIRSHTHYFSYCGGKDWLGVTTPALQAAGTKYGGRQCSGTVDWGLLTFDVDGGEFDWQAHLVDLKANKVKAVRL